MNFKTKTGNNKHNMIEWKIKKSQPQKKSSYSNYDQNANRVWLKS